MEKSIKKFKGKAIYEAAGKAAEYSKWACNFYVGCSNGCTYCYCKKGILANAMGLDKPQLKKCFKEEQHAIEIFERELKANLPELKKHGLFFSFTTDPMLPETISLTLKAFIVCLNDEVPVNILTKSTRFLLGVVSLNFPFSLYNSERKYVAFGFTLTGHDELETGASTNAERIEAMRKMHKAGFKTWASIEPVIDFESSLNMIEKTYHFCDLYKIGLESGAEYCNEYIRKFVNHIADNFRAKKLYFKDSLLKQAGISREDLPENCVDSDYNIFKGK